MKAVIPITADQITIAVTVYSRREYIKQAVASALAQTRPVRVIVVEDRGPDPELQAFVKGEFGDRIEYFRNPQRRGLFGNWNACLEYCKTDWLSILHDDDYLAPNFVDSIIALSQQCPGCALYFGGFHIVNETGQPEPAWDKPALTIPWRQVTLDDAYFMTPFAFAGQLFRTDVAKKLGGFRATSQYAGDWEMWAQLIADGGGAETRDQVAFTRTHGGADRGCNVVWRGGKAWGLSYVQHKRVIALLNRQGKHRHFDRHQMQARFPMSSRWLLQFGCQMSPRLLAYNLGLLKISPSPHWRHALFKAASRLFGAGFVRTASKAWNAYKR